MVVGFVCSRSMKTFNASAGDTHGARTRFMMGLKLDTDVRQSTECSLSTFLLHKLIFSTAEAVVNWSRIKHLDEKGGFQLK